MSPLRDITPNKIKTLDRLVCEYCKRGFDQEAALQAHAREHDGACPADLVGIVGEPGLHAEAPQGGGHGRDVRHARPHEDHVAAHESTPLVLGTKSAPILSENQNYFFILGQIRKKKLMNLTKYT